MEFTQFNIQVHLYHVILLSLKNDTENEQAFI